MVKDLSSAERKEDLRQSRPCGLAEHKKKAMKGKKVGDASGLMPAGTVSTWTATSHVSTKSQ